MVWRDFLRVFLLGYFVLVVCLNANGTHNPIDGTINPKYLTLRAENLSIADFIEITNCISEEK